MGKAIDVYGPDPRSFLAQAVGGSGDKELLAAVKDLAGPAGPEPIPYFRGQPRFQGSQALEQDATLAR